MKATVYNPRRMGAIPWEGATSFRIWAPNATSVSVVGEFNDWNPEADPLEREKDGLWARVVDDAYAREIHPKSVFSVIYADDYEWKSYPQVLLNWNELVICELHVGTFVPGPHNSPGRFEQVAARLPYLKNLGINAIEIMPPMAFPGERTWGYNLTNPFAVDGTYGGPDGMKRLIDAAHAQGVAVILDVVYNHFGPGNPDLWQYDGWSENNKGGIYFYNDHRPWAPWGDKRPDYGRGEVRQYIPIDKQATTS